MYRHQTRPQEQDHRVGTGMPEGRGFRPRGWRRLAGALLLAAGTASGQSLFDFETDLEGWAAVTFPEAGQTVSAAWSTAVATSGSGSMAVTKTPDEFSWTAQVSGGPGTNFFDVISNAVEDVSNTYDLVFDMIFRAADLPGAGGTNTTYVNSLIAMSSDVVTNQSGEILSGGWNQTSGGIGIGAAEIEALSDTLSVEVRVPLATFNLTPGSGYYELTLSLNGNYGSNATATVYYDNFRVEVFSPIFFDFSEPLDDDWAEGDLGTEFGLAPDVPTPGEQSLELTYTDFGEYTATFVSKGPGESMYNLIRDAVRDDPADYTLDFDFILLSSRLPAGATWVNPLITFNGDDGMGWDQQLLTDFQIDLTTITEDTVLAMQIPLDSWFWPASSGWNPTFIQMGLGTEVNNGGSYRFYYDNFAIRPVEVIPELPIVFTDLALQPGGDLSLSWGSVSGEVYAISGATDLVAPDWVLIASNLVAEPPENTWVQSAPTAPAEYYRVDRYSDEVTITLFDFEDGTDGWAALAASISVTNSDVAATSGTNSLAVTMGSADFWKVRWDPGMDATNDPAYASIRSALLDTNHTWYIVADFIYHGPSIGATNSVTPGYFNQQVSFNSDEGGWVEEGNVALIEGGPISVLGTNTTVFTWGFDLLDTGWGTTTNSYYQINIGASGDFSNISEATLHYDNFRLTNREP